VRTGKKDTNHYQNYIPTQDEQEAKMEKLPMWIDYGKVMERRFIIFKLIDDTWLKIKKIQKKIKKYKLVENTTVNIKKALDKITPTSSS